MGRGTRSFFSWAQLCTWCLWALGQEEMSRCFQKERCGQNREGTHMCVVKGRRAPRAKRGEPHAGEARDGGEGAGGEVGGAGESGVMEASGDDHICWARDSGDLSWWS